MAGARHLVHRRCCSLLPVTARYCPLLSVTTWQARVTSCIAELEGFMRDVDDGLNMPEEVAHAFVPYLVNRRTLLGEPPYLT